MDRSCDLLSRNHLCGEKSFCVARKRFGDIVKYEVEVVRFNDFEKTGRLQVELNVEMAVGWCASDQEFEVFLAVTAAIQ